VAGPYDSVMPLDQLEKSTNAQSARPVAVHPFHLAFPVRDIAEARAFYGELLGCSEGRSAADWVDFDFYGHQIVAHLAPGETGAAQRNAVDGHGVPVRHFGIVLPMAEWESMAKRLKAAGIEFVIEPYVRFKGEPGEQATMFFLDPSGNALEFKAFADIAKLFAK
jgi:extradiol dioxygenase family protein